MTTEEMAAVTTAGFADFTGDCGEGSDGHPRAATSKAGLHPDESVRLNGKSELSDCVIGNNYAKVHNISLVRSASRLYQYEVAVDAEGPEGAFSGSLYLAFKDGTGDIYHLSIFMHQRALHTVSYNSSNPTIFQFRWSNDPIPNW